MINYINEQKLSFLKKNKKKILILLIIIDITASLFFLLYPSQSQREWLEHYPETTTFMAFEYREGIGQFQFIKLNPNVIIDGTSTDLEIRIWSHSGVDGTFEPLDIRIKKGDFPYEIKFDEGYGLTDEIYTRFLPDYIHDYKVKVFANCNGCRNNSGITIELYDLEGNLLQKESVMIRMYNYETRIQEWYSKLFR